MAEKLEPGTQSLSYGSRGKTYKFSPKPCLGGAREECHLKKKIQNNTTCLFFFFKHLYWSIIALQWCVSFCFIKKVNQLYIYICPHISSLLHFPPTVPMPPL